jgi:hypothetical protein
MRLATYLGSQPPEAKGAGHDGTPSTQDDENVGAVPRACPSIAAMLGRTQGSTPTIDLLRNTNIVTRTAGI